MSSQRYTPAFKSDAEAFRTWAKVRDNDWRADRGQELLKTYESSRGDLS